jgi:hypothetical protein
MKRAYNLKDKEYPVYNDHFCRFKVESIVLNSAAQDMRSIHTVFLNKFSIEDEIKLTENRIEKNKQERETLKEQFVSYCKNLKNTGHKVPDDWPPDLLEKRLKLEAKGDIYFLELEYLEKKLSEIQEKDKEVKNKSILSFGLRGMGKLEDGVLVSIDGMKVSRTEDDVLIIDEDDPKAKDYTGYPVSEYYKLCTEYKTRYNSAKEEIWNMVKRGQVAQEDTNLQTHIPWPKFGKDVVNYKKLVEK